MPQTLPAILRLPLVDTSAQEADIGETCEFEAGEPLSSPLYRTTPNIVATTWHMTQAQYDAFDQWFEDTLLAGSLTFFLPMQVQGTALTATAEAMFLEMPECVYRHKDNWEVSAQCVTGEFAGEP